MELDDIQNMECFLGVYMSANLYIQMQFHTLYNKMFFYHSVFQLCLAPVKIYVAVLHILGQNVSVAMGA